ncbi:MAG: penicillin acylase family protein, partial [Bryobacteraceae bacterium]
MPHRILKYINAGIAGVALVAGTGAWWFAWRPLPRTSGVVTTLVERPVKISRDRLGVPHISAQTIDDALFAQGYVTAQDRLWQMEALRRFAGGELAEIAGVAALESDREARTLRLRKLADDAQRKLPATDRAAMAAYARGVNAFLETHRDRLPLEFSLLRVEPRPWRVSDSVLAGLYMFRNLTTTWKDEIQKRNLLAGGDRDKVNTLFPVRTGGEAQPGSNAWAIAGKHTATGRPILANDMHLEWGLPGVWYMAHLAAPGLNASGVTVPGLPGVIVGHNDRIAWGIANLHYDVQDLYIETGQARAEPETILVKGGRPAPMIVLAGRHGPIVVAAAGERLSLRWTASEPGIFQFPFLDVNRARNWTEFRAALERFPGPGANFVYADVEGNIGYQAAGRLPIRKNHAGDVPAGEDGDWLGYIPFDELPTAFNPADGVIVTANQNPFPASYRYAVHGNFASHYRSTQIRRLLGSRGGWRAADMLAVQKDVYSAFSHFLARTLVESHQRRKATNPILQAPVELLRGWNGQMEHDRPEPLIVTLGFQHLRKAVAERASPGKGPLYDLQMAPAVIET